mmetsp:Transcript_3037/g.6828  ORF Transcript_3037/g.6828 Transcript_3037/m.6828 type:complete len:96 (-) Transcript_3037:123-410(-)
MVGAKKAAEENQTLVGAEAKMAGDPRVGTDAKFKPTRAELKVKALLSPQAKPMMKLAAVSKRKSMLRAEKKPKAILRMQWKPNPTRAGRITSLSL